MSISDRQHRILDLLTERGYITVNELSAIQFTSPSSIRRDLTALQNSGQVRRLHGGVELAERLCGVPSLTDRMKKNVLQKRQIAKEASAYIHDGQRILLDGSSTAGFLLPYIAKHQGVSLFTNNISVAVHAIEPNIYTTLLGGHSVNGSMALAGPFTYKALGDILPDILFFSSQSIDENGVITDSTEEENYLRTLMLEASERRIFLCDSSKFYTRSGYVLTTLDKVECMISDKPFAAKERK